MTMSPVYFENQDINRTKSLKMLMKPILAAYIFWQKHLDVNLLF